MGIEALFSTGRGNLEARAAGITNIMGGMTSKIDDLDLVRRLAERSKVLGASGALAIHPSHIAILNEVFAPSKEEIAEAHEIIDAMREAIARGDAAVRLGSGMVDYAHVRTSIDLLREAQAFGLDAGEIPDMAIPSFDD
jgi:citrate lyase subunit beta/citryl-CoA lyase